MATDSSTFQGYWREASGTKELPGILTITPEEITLRLIGAFAETMFQRESVPKLLIGSSNKRKPITLFQLTSYTVNWGQGIPSSTYKFKFALIGFAAKSIRDLYAREVHVTSARVDEWLTELDGVKADYGESSWRIEVHDVPDRVLLDTPDLRVLHTYALSSSEDTLHRSPSIQRVGWFFVDAKKKIPLLDLMERKEHMRHLMSFIMNEEVDFERVDLVLRIKPLVKVECYEARKANPRRVAAAPVVPLVAYDNIRNNWAGLVEAWFANRDRLNHFIRFYVDGVQVGADPIQKFLALCKSLEAIHREWMARSNREWANFRPAMKACILFSRAISSRHFTITRIQEYTKQLKELRDAFSHGRNPYYRDKIDFRQLQWRSRELHEVVAACLLMKLGVPTILLKQSLRREALIGHWPRRNFSFVQYQR